MFWTRNQKNGNFAVATTVPRPLARTEHLIVQEVDDEVLVYDSSYAMAHCLSPEAARVWRACDGVKTVDALADELELAETAVVAALAELEEKELLDYGSDVEEGNGNGSTRREFGLRAAKIGAATAAAPMIVSIVAPTPAAAATPTELQCNFFSGSSCDACTRVCGCCCCCQGCPKVSGGTTTLNACKMCSAIRTCSQHSPGCTDQIASLGGTGTCQTNGSPPKCSAEDKTHCVPACVDGQPNEAAACGQHDCNCFGIAGNVCGTPT